MEKLLSIIIPVYNVEPYIRKCLDSLLLYTLNQKGESVLDEQRMGLMDILIINDGTPDKSAEISREYVKKYPKYFRQIDKENGGHGSVWNLGIREAYGKYIHFLDSDDWLDNVGMLLDKLQVTDLDLILTHTMDHCANNKLWLERVRGFEFNREYDMNTYDWIRRKENLLCFLHHGCTFKRKVLLPEMPLFIEKQPYDDGVLPYALINGANTLIAYDFVVYHYLVDRPGQSIAAEMNEKICNVKIRSDMHTIQFVKKHIKEQESTKVVFLKHRLKKLCQSWYIPKFSISYELNRKCADQWDRWIYKQNTHFISPFVYLYRHLPYKLYYHLCRICFV